MFGDSFIGTIIIFIAAGTLIFLYLKPGIDFFYKKKWIIIIASCLVLAGLVDIAMALKPKHKPSLLSKEAIEELFKTEGIQAAEDMTYTSDEGYQVYIPRGFTYISTKKGELSFAAKKGEIEYTIKEFDGSSSLDKITENILKGITRIHPSMKVESLSDIYVGDTDIDAFRLECKNVRNNIARHIIIVLYRDHVSDKQFMITLTCPEDEYLKHKPNFEKLINSFTID